MDSASLEKKWNRLQKALKPLRKAERPPSEHGVRLMALEALERKDGEAALLLATAATELPFEFHGILVGLPFQRAVERARELLFAPEVPKRGEAPRLEVQYRVQSKLLTVFAVASAKGLLKRDLNYYRVRLQVFRERDLRLMRVYVKEGMAVYGELDANGILVLPEEFYQGLEDLLVVWHHLVTKGVERGNAVP